MAPVDARGQRYLSAFNRLSAVFFAIGFLFLAYSLCYGGASKWRVFSNRAGWSIKYPADWKIASCRSCSDPTAPNVFVDFLPPGDSDTGWVMIEHLRDKPPSTSLEAWFTEVKRTANLNPQIFEQRLKLGQLAALKVRYRNSSGGGLETEDVYVVSGSRTFSISFDGERPGVALERHENYPIYLEMVESFKVKP